MRAALLDDQMVVKNVIKYDPENEFRPGRGLILAPLMETDRVGPGYVLTPFGEFQPSGDKPDENVVIPIEERLDSLEAAVDQLILDQLMKGAAT